MPCTKLCSQTSDQKTCKNKSLLEFGKCSSHMHGCETIVIQSDKNYWRRFERQILKRIIELIEDWDDWLRKKELHSTKGKNVVRFTHSLILLGQA